MGLVCWHNYGIGRMFCYATECWHFTVYLPSLTYYGTTHQALHWHWTAIQKLLLACHYNTHCVLFDAHVTLFYLLVGSRPGAIIAACWATMMYYGDDGYVETTRKIIETTRYIRNKYVWYHGLVSNRRPTGVFQWLITHKLLVVHVYRFWCNKDFDWGITRPEAIIFKYCFSNNRIKLKIS